MRRFAALFAIATLGLSAVGCSSTESDKAAGAHPDDAQALNVYSSRHYDVDKEIYDMFEKESGLKINVVEGKSGELVERIVREKNAPQADVFLTVGAESIAQLREAGVMAPSTSEVIEQNIIPNFRGEDWMGIVSRARVIAYDKEKVDPSTITSYEDLTKPEWKGKILVRPSSSSYNQALLASFVALYGEEKAKEWAKGVTENFARDPKGNDRDQAKAVAAGEGELAIMNSYYWAQMFHDADPEVKKITDKVGLIFPKETHMNLSYATVLKGAHNNEAAIKFLEFLSSEKVQKLIAERNGEFPLNPHVERPEPQKSWGDIDFQKQLDYGTFGKSMPVATRIFDEVGWK